MEQLPVGMAYSGVMFGLYALGELKKCLTPADLRSPNGKLGTERLDVIEECTFGGPF